MLRHLRRVAVSRQKVHAVVTRSNRTPHGPSTFFVVSRGRKRTVGHPARFFTLQQVYSKWAVLVRLFGLFDMLQKVAHNVKASRLGTAPGAFFGAWI